MADYAPTLWVDDDGSNQVGTPFSAANMNKIEQGIVAAGSALPKPTTDWNLAVTPFSWRSLNNAEIAANGFVGTIHGPGDPLNPPDAVGYTLVQDSQIVQRVYALGMGFFTRVKPQGGAWTIWVADLMKPPVLTGLLVGAPAPVEGDERYFQNAAMDALGTMWRFRYRAGSASASKWEFVGGAAMLAGPFGDLTTASNAGTMLTGGPTLTCPVSGVYNCEIEAAIQLAADGLAQGNIGVAKNGVLVTATMPFIGRNLFDGANVGGERLVTLAGGDVVGIICLTGNPVNIRYFTGSIKLTPVRVTM